MVNPSVMRMSIRRPSKLGNKTNDEQKNPTCFVKEACNYYMSKYGSMGHNKRTCKGKMGANRVMPKGGNKTKKQKTTKGKGKK